MTSEDKQEVKTMVTDAVQEITEVIGEFAEHIEQRFDGLEQRVSCVEATMVTKSYLDDKLNDLKGDTVAMLRKEDQSACP